MSVELDYVGGDAWAIVTGPACAVFTRALVAGEARALHELMRDAATLDDVIDHIGGHPFALAILGQDARGTRLLRRRGVPALVDGALQADAFGDAWLTDLVAPGAAIHFGDVTTGAGDSLPLGHGIVRVRAILATASVPTDAAPAADAPAPTADWAAPADEQVEPDLGDTIADRAVADGTVPDGTGAEPAAAGPSPLSEVVSSVNPALADPASLVAQHPALAADDAVVDETVMSADAAVASEWMSASEPAPEHTLVEGVDLGGSPDQIEDIIDSVPGYIRPATHVEAPPAAPRPAAPATATPPARSFPEAAPDQPAAAEAAAIQPEAAEDAPVPTDDPIDDATVHGTFASSSPAPQSDAANWRLTASPNNAPPAGSPSAPSDAPLGDHDGFTVTPEQARHLRERLAAANAELVAPAQPHGPATQAANGPSPHAAPPGGLAETTSPLVVATLCGYGHINPQGLQLCRVCGTRVDPGSVAQRPRPQFAGLRLPSGELVPLDRGAIFGRRPRASRIEQAPIPRLVAVASPNDDISRSHLQVVCEDWAVLATDLDSTNGTMLIRPGTAPMRLRPYEPTIVMFGDTLDLGDGVVLQLEATA